MTALLNSVPALSLGRLPNLNPNSTLFNSYNSYSSYNSYNSR